MEELKEIRLTRKEKIIISVAVTSGVIAGFMIGNKYATNKISKGLSDVWKANPGLQEIMYHALKQPSTWIMNVEEC